MNAVNTEIAYTLMLIHAQARQIELKHGWLMSLLIWGMEVDYLGERVLSTTKDRVLRRDVRQLMNRAPGALQVSVALDDPEPDDPFKEGYGRSLVVALLTGIKSGLESCWTELRSVEIAVGEVADEEFDGEELFQADARRSLDEAKQMLMAVHEGIAPYVEPFDLADPGDDDVGLVRKLIEHAAK